MKRGVLIALLLIVAVTSIGGGLALATGLEGGRFPLSWLGGTPFPDFVGPGLILAGVVGGSATVAAVTVVRMSSIGPRVSLAAGILLVGWIAGEIILVRADGQVVSPTEALYLLVGVAISGLAVALDRCDAQTREP
jgi:hypothetical protein